MVAPNISTRSLNFMVVVCWNRNGSPHPTGQLRWDGRTHQAARRATRISSALFPDAFRLAIVSSTFKVGFLA